jgi:aminopeptidase
MNTFAAALKQYAYLTVTVGLNLQPGQRLLICDAPLECAPLVRLIAASAYQAGARLVDVLWRDEALIRARFEHAPRDSFTEFPVWRTDALLEAAQRGDAFLYSYGAAPDLLADQDPTLVSQVQRLHEQYRLPHLKTVMTTELNWSVIGMPVQAWAAKIFPDDPPSVQLGKLWDTIFKLCRLDQADPVAAWQVHTEKLALRRDYLNAKQYVALHYHAPGTQLTVGLPANHRWIAGAKQSRWGTPFIPNLPTEEIFTMPHKEQVEGVVTATKPLSYGGRLVENFSLTFAGGRVVRVVAEKGQSILEGVIKSDAGAACLGEVALVPDSSLVSQTGLLFYNILFDENAASHLALGRAYRDCLAQGPALTEAEFAAAGGNDSAVHLDFMIGSSQLDIDGLTTEGEIEPVMRAGEWAF